MTTKLSRSLALVATAGVLISGLGSCSPKGQDLYLTPYKAAKKVVDNSSAQEFNPEVDILFVIDNSGSMSDHQRNLANNIGQFVNVFTQSSILDYNIAIITTDDSGSSSGGACCGRFLGSATKVVNKNTVNRDRILTSLLMPGISGSGTEVPFDTTVSAMSPVLLNGWNSGFLRPNATLIVIILTDGDDNGSQAPIQVYNYLLGVKGGDAKKVLAYGAIIPSTEVGCRRDDGTYDSRRLEEFFGLFPSSGHNIVSLCAPDYGTQLAGFASDIVAKVASTIYLSHAPVLGTIRVTYGNLELPEDLKTGWAFSPRLNAIQLGSDIDWGSQPQGSKVNVYYKAATYK